LPFEDAYNLKQNLTPNIKFVFGPPGTGKTTFLAKDELIPLMQRKGDLKILVLTPTNKAADVLTSRIMEVMGEDESYYNWLVRFGLTGNPDIEQSPIYRDKTFDIQTKPKNVTVTTIARFPYDYFQSENSETRLHLRELTWDYIVIDEASMIPIFTIIFPLYYKCNSKFIIAGDPFQIQPITSVEDWKDENIYTLVELNKFSNPTTVPHLYEVINLTTQYRSIPSIGDVFSLFTYEGILKHYRSANTQKPLSIDGINVKALNIIKFPASKYESIYRSKRLNNSPYHIYSAVFTFEFAKYLSKQIIKNYKETYKIGIICPYRAQASLVEKLFASQPFETTNTDIQIGTIHGFQGDECDIIISLFNPPPFISSSSDMFLNKQNILNVSISRARDYLFVLMPDEKTENLFNLKKVNKIEKIIKDLGKDIYTETHTENIEQVIFANDNFIEENSFATTHQAVNVYSEAEKLYEIRCEETAIDVQVGKNKVQMLMQ
jgi:superfamily I DNA and/or RNA helicase